MATFKVVADVTFEVVAYVAVDERWVQKVAGARREEVFFLK